MKKLKIAFVVDKIGFLELFSIPILSSLSKRQGHSVRLIEFGHNQKKACNEIVSLNPDIVAYSICSNETKRFLNINKILKNRASFLSLFGGPHPTFFPSFIREEGVDAIYRGEGDISFPAFLKDFGEDKMYGTKNFSFKKDGGEIIENSLADLLPDLDNLPFPDREIIYSISYFLANNPIKSFFAGRGCPFDCSYCFNHAYNAMYRGKGRIMRTKSITYLFNEIKTVADRYPLTFIKFQDDIFGHNHSWLAEFAQRYPREIKLPFLCYARPNMITEGYCRQLKRSGCYSVSLAIECGNERIRNSILNRNTSDEQIISACENLRKYGIRMYVLSMIGLPQETDNDIFQTLELNERVKPDFADASIFQPYPGTKITEYCKAQGYLDKKVETFASQFSTSILNFEPDFKERIYIFHKLFTIFVDHPNLRSGLLKFLFRVKKFPLFKEVLNIIYRFYYGLNLHRRIYASKIPLIVRMRGVLLLLLSKNRA